MTMYTRRLPSEMDSDERERHYDAVIMGFCEYALDANRGNFDPRDRGLERPACAVCETRFRPHEGRFLFTWARDCRAEPAYTFLCLDHYERVCKQYAEYANDPAKKEKLLSAWNGAVAGTEGWRRMEQQRREWERGAILETTDSLAAGLKTGGGAD